MKFKNLLLLAFIGFLIPLQAQDFHNSYFQFAPQNINPALTGAFYGNLRANVIGRDQGRAITGAGNEFQDLSIALDGSINFGFTKGDWVSAGMNVARSQSVGFANFNRRFSGISLAYHFSFNKDQTAILTLGGKYGTYATGFDIIQADRITSTYMNDNNFSLADDTDARTFQSGSQNQPDLQSTSDYSVGLMLTTPVGKSSDLRIGYSLDHLLNPQLDIKTDSIMGVPGVQTFRENLERRTNIFITYYTPINEKLTFNPNILYQKMGDNTNIVIQGLMHLLFDPEKEITLTGGLGVRLANSMDIPIYLGADIKSWRVGLSYDLNISGLRPSTNTFGALELGVTKIFSWHKKPKVNPVFICPRL